MPECKKCKNKYPYRILIEGKYRLLHKRKYCLDCSPFGQHNTKRLDKVLHRDGKDIRVCKICSREFEWNPKKGNKGFTCNSCNANAKRFRIKQKAVEYKGGKCVDCGYNECIQALAFHHLDPNSKDFNIGGSHSRSWEKNSKRTR